MNYRSLSLVALLLAAFVMTACSDATAPKGDDPSPCGIGNGVLVCEK